jgi:hypothetical protein
MLCSAPAVVFRDEHKNHYLRFAAWRLDSRQFSLRGGSQLKRRRNLDDRQRQRSSITHAATPVVDLGLRHQT